MRGSARVTPSGSVGPPVRGRTLSEKLRELPAVRRQRIEERAAELIAKEASSVRASALAKMRADADAGWKDIDAGRVSDFDAAAIKLRGRRKVARTKGDKRRDG